HGLLRRRQRGRGPRRLRLLGASSRSRRPADTATVTSMEPRSLPEHEVEPDYELEPYRGYDPIQPEPGWRDILRKIWAPVAAVGAFVAKFGAVLFKLKIFTVAGSMLVSVGAYALLGGWWFGVGLVGLIFVHEMGHVLELRRQGVPASAPLFIPFLAALVGLVLLEVYRPTPILPIIILLGALELWRRWQTRNHPQLQSYYRVLPWQRAAVATVYLGLAALLVLGMHATHVPRSF